MDQDGRNIGKGERVMEYGFICGHCMSNNVYSITEWKGKAVVPDPLCDIDSGIVVKCRDCGDITGYIIHMTGVIGAEASE